MQTVCLSGARMTASAVHEGGRLYGDRVDQRKSPRDSVFNATDVW